MDERARRPAPRHRPAGRRRQGHPAARLRAGAHRGRHRLAQLPRREVPLSRTGGDGLLRPVRRGVLRRRGASAAASARLAKDLMITRILEALFTWISGVISAMGYPGVVLLMAIESCCMPLPSEMIMPFAGWLVATGRFNLCGIALGGAIGCVVSSVEHTSEIQ